MQITILNVRSGKQAFFDMAGKTLHVGSDNDNDLILNEIGEHQLRIVNEKNNIFVTNLDGAIKINLADRELRTNITWVWSSGQDLRIGDLFVLYHDGIRETQHPPFAWNKIISSALIAAIAGLLLLTMFRFINNANQQIRVIRQASIAATRQAISMTATSEAQITTTEQVSATTTPTFSLQAPTALPILPPQRAITVDNVTITPIPTQTLTLTANSEMSGSVANATPIREQSWLTTEVWAGDVLQPSLLKALEIDRVPAMIVRGEPFWHLQKVVWLNEGASNGRHHIYVDVRDKNGNRLVKKKVVISWSDGNCVRETVERATEFDKPWSDYGADCAMFSAGRVYTAWVFGAPSDQLVGLGLGTPGQRDIPLLTSYLLIFQETIVN